MQQNKNPLSRKYTPPDEAAQLAQLSAAWLVRVFGPDTALDILRLRVKHREGSWTTYLDAIGRAILNHDSGRAA